MPKISKRGGVSGKGSKSSGPLICVFVVALIVVAAYYIYRANKMSLLENFESNDLNNLVAKPNPNNKEVVLVLFYVDWCPHCVSTKPEWSNLVNNLNNKEVNGVNVKVNACNAEGSAAEKEFASENNVQGYPTIKLITNNEAVEYNGARTALEMENFVRENCN